MQISTDERLIRNTKLRDAGRLGFLLKSIDFALGVRDAALSSGLFVARLRLSRQHVVVAPRLRTGADALNQGVRARAVFLQQDEQVGFAGRAATR